MEKDLSTGNAAQDKKRRFISLRFLASLAAAALVAVTGMTLVWVNEKNIRETLEQESQTQLVLEARNLANTSSDALLSEFPELTLIPLAKDFQNGRPEILVCVQDASPVLLSGDGEVLAHIPTMAPPTLIAVADVTGDGTPALLTASAGVVEAVGME